MMRESVCAAEGKEKKLRGGSPDPPRQYAGMRKREQACAPCEALL